MTLREKTGYCKLKDEVLHCREWINSYGPAVRQTTECTDVKRSDGALI